MNAPWEEEASSGKSFLICAKGLSGEDQFSATNSGRLFKAAGNYYEKSNVEDKLKFPLRRKLEEVFLL
jgi:hypothetical protein